MSYINNFIAVVKLSKGKRSTICGYFTDSYEYDQPITKTDYSRITVGFLHHSRDGEVRKSTISTSDIDNVVKDPIWDDIEDGILPFIKNMELSVLFYFPCGTSAKAKEHFKNRVKDDRYDIIIAIMHIYVLLEANEHTPPPDTLSYDFMLDNLDELMQAKKMIDDKSHRDALSKLTLKYTYQIMATKIIPLTVAESQNIENIRYRVWREYYVQQMCLFIFLFNISNQFTKYFSPWHMLHNIDEDMFQNPSILSKFRYSNVIEKFQQQFQSLQNLPSIANKIASTPDTSREEFDTLLQYSADNLAISKFAITFYSMSVTIPAYMAINNMDADEVRELLFHWFYAFFILHSIIGTIHCDAHVGNLHIRTFVHVMRDVVIDDMIFHPSKQVVGFLLDFSRVVVNPYHQLVRAYARGVSQEVFAMEQGEFLLRFYIKCFPKARNIDTIINAIKKDFDRTFHVLSLLDPIFALGELRASINNAEVLMVIDTMLGKCVETMNSLLASETPIEVYPLKKIIMENFSMTPFKQDSNPHTLRYNPNIIEEIQKRGFRYFDAANDDKENILAR